MSDGAVGSGRGPAVGPSAESAQHPDTVVAWAADRRASGELTVDDVKESLHSIDALAANGASAADCRDATAAVLDLAHTAGVRSRGPLVLQANLLARLGDVEAAAEKMIAAFAAFPDDWTPGHAREAVSRCRSHGPAATSAFIQALRAAGVPVALQGASAVVVSDLSKARDGAGLTAAVDALERAGGFPDVVAAGQGLQILRTAAGRSADHALRLFRLAAGSCGLTPRIVNDTLIVLAELGAAEESATVLREAEAAGQPPTSVHRVSYISALNNAMRYDEALAEYDRYIADGLPAAARVRRVQVLALCWAERPTDVRKALDAWAEAVRADTVEAPSPGLLTTALTALARDDVSLCLDAVEGGLGIFPLNNQHRSLVLDAARRSRALTDYARALAAFSSERSPTEAELRHLLKLTSGHDDSDVAAALDRVIRADATTLPALAPVLVRTQLAADDLLAAEATAQKSGNPLVIESVVQALLAVDMDAALRVMQLFESDSPAEGESRAQPMPHPSQLVGRMVRALAATRGPSAAEAWLRRYSQKMWPVEAWESLATVYRRDKGNVSAIEWVMRRMRNAGTAPSGDVWAAWLYAMPRHKRAARVAEARDAMRKDGVSPSAAFFTAAIVGALQPEKVRPDNERSTEEVAWDNAQTALETGEKLLVEAAAALTRKEGIGAATSWFTPDQLLEIARAYPLTRRPYAQLDSAVETRVAGETEPEEQFAAFLGAIAAAHARAQLPKAVRRVRRAAVRVSLGGRPELTASLLDSLRGAESDEVVAAVIDAVRYGSTDSPLVAEAAGRALAGTGRPDVVWQVLDGGDEWTLEDDAAEQLLSAALLRFADEGQDDEAKEVGRVAEERGLVLSPTAQAALLTTHRPEVPVAEQGPVWTTAQLAAYNSLLEHELANHLRASRASAELLRAVVGSLRRQHPAESAVSERDLAALDDVVAGLKRSHALQQRSIAKISAAAEMERLTAGTVPVLPTIEAVVEQFDAEAAAAHTEIRILDPGSGADMAVRGHATLLQFALHNLVSNAVKSHARRKDEVRRTVELLATFDESDREDLAVAPYGWVVVSVRDHGDGVPEDLPDNVANWSIPGQPGQGLGIGLRFTENMVRQSGGQLWIDTTVAEGSRFCFRLPSAARRDAQAAHRTIREEDQS